MASRPKIPRADYQKTGDEPERVACIALVPMSHVVSWLDALPIDPPPGPHTYVLVVAR